VVYGYRVGGAEGRVGGVVLLSIVGDGKKRRKSGLMCGADRRLLSTGYCNEGY